MMISATIPPQLLPRQHARGTPATFFPFSNPLLRAAQGILECIPLLKSPHLPLPLPDLRQHLIGMVQQFSAWALDSGEREHIVQMARYCLCTLVDETIASTSWGNTVWGQHSLLVTFHHEAAGGERFFRILQWLARDPDRHYQALEFLYVLMSLGIHGHYRLKDSGLNQHEYLRERLYWLLRNRCPATDSMLLSDCPPPVMPGKRRSSSPNTWLAIAVIGLALLSGTVYWTGAIGLRQQSQALIAANARIQPLPDWTQLLLAAPASGQATLDHTLETLLAPEIAKQLIALEISHQQTVIIFSGDGLFDSGSSQIHATLEPLLLQIGQALKQVPGSIMVTGYTDNQPSVRGMPNNVQLSRSRANTVARLLMAVTGQPARYLVTGRGDSDPLVANDSPAHRARNRRVSITVNTRNDNATSG